MNKYQEALTTIKQCIYEASKETINPNELEEIKVLQELVYKATPKKPIERHYEDEGEPEYIKVCCPAGCKVQVGNYYNFCPECGQALDWSDD